MKVSKIIYSVCAIGSVLGLSGYAAMGDNAPSMPSRPGAVAFTPAGPGQVNLGPNFAMTPRGPFDVNLGPNPVAGSIQDNMARGMVLTPQGTFGVNAGPNFAFTPAGPGPVNLGPNPAPIYYYNQQ